MLTTLPFSASIIDDSDSVSNPTSPLRVWHEHHMVVEWLAEDESTTALLPLTPRPRAMSPHLSDRNAAFRVYATA